MNVWTLQLQKFKCHPAIVWYEKNHNNGEPSPKMSQVFESLRLEVNNNKTMTQIFILTSYRPARYLYVRETV